MAFEIPRISYNGKIKEIQLGQGAKAVTVGGETTYPFYHFEGKMANLPRIAMEVYDYSPKEWPPAALEPFAGVMDDPAAWARKCIDSYGAEVICLQLQATDPNGLNRNAEEAAQMVKRVSESIEVPLIVWGSANLEKDTEVLCKIAEVCQGRDLVLGPVEEGNYKKIGAAAIGYHHIVAASSPIDINLAKQLNILMGNLGVPDSCLLIDPTVSGIGYGMEYSYSVMERIRIAALSQGDDKLQFPFICNIAKEVWKTKEAQIAEKDDPKLGDATQRAVLLEAISGICLLLAGADILVLRHPMAVKLVREVILDLSLKADCDLTRL